MHASPNSVAAVVVTFNRIRLLQECIEALRAQTHTLARIIVINNSSTDGTTEWLATQPDLLSITQENRGGAFGFYTGFKTALDVGFEWIWCMDDDGRPALDALERIMAYAHRKPCVINALVLDKDNPARIVFPTGGYTEAAAVKEPLIEDGAAFFNGSLFHRDIVSELGLPMKDLTIWGDETEYYNRIRFRGGFPIFTVAASHHYHPAQLSVFYKREWDVKTDWKVYFYIRNKVYVYRSQHKAPGKARMAYMKFLAAFAATIFVYQKKDRPQKLRLLRRAMKDALSGDLSMGVKEVRAMLEAY